MVLENSMTWLMPLAAALGTYVLIGTFAVIVMIYRALKGGEENGEKVKKWKLCLILSSVLLAVVGYGRVVAMVNQLEELAAPFNPWEILDLEDNSNVTLIKKSYRRLSLKYHPDKSTDMDIDSFNKVNAAYRALTDSVGKRNWEDFGHPDGAAHFQKLSFGLPSWLLEPKGGTAVTLVILYLGLLVYLGYYVFSKLNDTSSAETTLMKNNDLKYIMNLLTEDATHLDVLYILASVPGAVKSADSVLKQYEACREQKKSTKKALDLSGPWADDVEEDEESKKLAEKIAEKERKMEKEKKMLELTTGKKPDLSDMKMEDVDKGVLGPKWVEKVLRTNKLWPPKKSKYTLKHEGAGLENPIELPALKLNLMLVTARLHSKLLNSQPDFFDCQQKQLLDSIYYRYSLQFRQSMLSILDVVTRMISSVKNYKLTKTLIETAAIFRVGVYPYNKETFQWFHRVLLDKYGIIPKLDISKVSVSTPDEDDIATNDKCELAFSILRVHAESFTKAKVEQAQRQGVPVPTVLSQFRECWWVLLTAKMISSNKNTEQVIEDDFQLDEDVKKVAGEEILKFYPKHTNDAKLITVWPLICSNVAQKTGDMKFKFLAPNVPGKYRFTIEFINQEFLDCNTLHNIEIEVVDSKKIQLDQEDHYEEPNEETKKDK